MSEETNTKVWRNQPDDKHTWAFYYYLKRRDDTVKVKADKQDDGSITIHWAQEK